MIGTVDVPTLANLAIVSRSSACVVGHNIPFWYVAWMN
jgi:hypothetical protein